MSNPRRMDEMEMTISFRAVRLAWVYANLFLLAWIIFDWIGRKTLNSPALILLCSQLCLYWGTQLILKRRWGNGEE